MTLLRASIHDAPAAQRSAGGSNRLAAFLSWRSHPRWQRDAALGLGIAVAGIALRYLAMRFEPRLAHMSLLPFVAIAALLGRPLVGLTVVLVTGSYLDLGLILAGSASGYFGFSLYVALGVFIVWVCEAMMDALGVAQTDRHRVHAVETFNASLIQSSNDPIVTKSLDGLITGWNPAAERVFGYEASEALGKPITMLFPSDRFDEEEEILGKVRHGETVRRFATKRISKSGQELDVSVTVWPIFNEYGAIVGASKVVRDITQQKQTAEALRASEELLRCALDGAKAGAWSWDCASSVSDWSPRFFEMHGLRPELDTPSFALWLESVYPEDCAAASRRLNAVLNSDACDYNDRYRVRLSDGEIRWIEIFGRIERDFNGEPRRIAGICIDATERHDAVEAMRRSNQELKRANESLKQFSSIAAHDLQEPLRKIEQFGDLLMQEYATAVDNDGAFYLKVMRDSARRMRALINDLLAFSRAGHRPLTVAPIETNDLTQRVLSACSAAIEEANARIEVGPLPPLVGDERLVESLFQNLISNAIKYRKPDMAPSLTVKARREADAVVYDFSDDGIGIAPEHQQIIFEPFTRLNAREAMKGTGIGLAFCRTVCERHGWRLTVSSELGVGSTFSVVVPSTP